MTIRVDRLISLREESGYTLNEVGERVGISGQHVWRIEQGVVNPKIKTLQGLAVVYNTSVDYLTGDTDERTPLLRIDSLSSIERAVVLAMRRGDSMGAIRVIADKA